MTKQLEKAIAEVRKLPSDRQEEIAGLLLSIIDHDSSSVHLNPQQVADRQQRLVSTRFTNWTTVETHGGNSG